MCCIIDDGENVNGFALEFCMTSGREITIFTLCIRTWNISTNIRNDAADDAPQQQFYTKHNGSWTVAIINMLGTVTLDIEYFFNTCDHINALA